jgi:RHS repeat-associated protein
MQIEFTYDCAPSFMHSCGLWASRFTGKERDAESGLDYFGARYYGSNTGRFMSPDPSVLDYADPTNPQSLNLYSYVINNPLRFIDPFGFALQIMCSPAAPDTYSEGFSGNGDQIDTVNVGKQNCDVQDDGTDPPVTTTIAQQTLSPSARPYAPSNAQEPPPACQAKILNATNNQFGTNYTNSNVTSTFNYSTGAGPGQGTLNLNISGSTAGVSTGYYPVHWYTCIIGYGPTLHVVGGDVLDSPQTLPFGPNQGTFHIDSGYPINPIGAAFHWLLNMTKAGGYPKC